MNTASTIRGLILDIDGVLWRGNQPIGDLPAVFAGITERGWRVVLVTNNSTAGPDVYLAKLRSFGVDLQPWQIVTSAEGAALYLSNHFATQLAVGLPFPPVYVIGESGLREMIVQAGFRLVDEQTFGRELTTVSAVVAGLDRLFNYEKLKQASDLIRQGALFVGTNDDATLPTPQGPIPGAGAILAALAKASGRKPLVIGKPEPLLYELAMQRLGTSPAETIAIGDRLETDILGGQRLGLRTGLVLSGVTNAEAAAHWQPQPDWIAEDLTSLLKIIGEGAH